MRILFTIIVAVFLIAGCSRHVVQYERPSAAQKIESIRVQLLRERAMREAIAQASPHEQAVTRRLLADPRIASVMFAHVNPVPMMWGYENGEAIAILHYTFWLVVETNEDMRQETFELLVRQAMLAEDLHPLQEEFGLIHHEGVWATRPWQSIAAALGPPQAPRALDETSYDHVGDTE